MVQINGVTRQETSGYLLTHYAIAADPARRHRSYPRARNNPCRS